MVSKRGRLGTERGEEVVAIGDSIHELQCTIFSSASFENASIHLKSPEGEFDVHRRNGMIQSLVSDFTRLHYGRHAFMKEHL